jgi:hypothetical protein
MVRSRHRVEGTMTMGASRDRNPQRSTKKYLAAMGDEPDLAGTRRVHEARGEI